MAAAAAADAKLRRRRRGAISVERRERGEEMQAVYPPAMTSAPY